MQVCVHYRDVTAWRQLQKKCETTVKIMTVRIEMCYNYTNYAIELEV